MYGMAIRAHGDALAELCREQELPVSGNGVLDSYSLIPEEKAARYSELLRELPIGISEWAVHPSLGNAESQALEPDSWQIRRADYDFFTSTEARDLLKAEEITVISYRDLQSAWQTQ